MSAPYLNTLDKKRAGTFLKLRNFSDKFVLAGGTAVMLLTNYRLSFDFDCFSTKPLKRSLLAKARRVFGDDINIQVDNSKLLLFTTADKVKVDFVHFPYPPIHPTLRTKSISLFDLRDLASNKAYTIGRRATWRDYADMFFLVEKFGLDLIIKEANKRFKGEFSEKLFLEQLVYFDDLEILPIEFIEKPYTNKEIRDRLQSVVEEYTQKKVRVNDVH